MRATDRSPKQATKGAHIGPLRLSARGLLRSGSAPLGRRDRRDRESAGREVWPFFRTKERMAMKQGVSGSVVAPRRERRFRPKRAVGRRSVRVRPKPLRRYQVEVDVSRWWGRSSERSAGAPRQDGQHGSMEHDRQGDDTHPRRATPSGSAGCVTMARQVHAASLRPPKRSWRWPSSTAGAATTIQRGVRRLQRSKRQASAAARRSAPLLCSVSSYSATGSLSATTPPPAWTYMTPSLKRAVRSRMQASTSPWLET